MSTRLKGLLYALSAVLAVGAIIGALAYTKAAAVSFMKYWYGENVSIVGRDDFYWSQTDYASNGGALPQDAVSLTDRRRFGIGAVRLEPLKRTVDEDSAELEFAWISTGEKLSFDTNIIIEKMYGLTGYILNVESCAAKPVMEDVEAGEMRYSRTFIERRLPAGLYRAVGTYYADGSDEPRYVACRFRVG